MERPIPPPPPLIAREIHGFNTTADLNMEKLMEDATKRWFRPNELHAILSNHTLFKIQPQPVDRPSSGSLLLFDRRMLRNFRKDGHNWKKKKDGKTVQEAHEKLKIGNEEKIHVYYARNEDDPNFYRRCYWLLDKELERIVLVHYLQASEENAKQLLPIPIEPKEVLYSTSPLRSSNASNHSELSSSLFEEINSGAANVFQAGFQTSTGKNPELNLAGLDSLCWEDIMEQPSCVNLSAQRNGHVSSSAQQQTEYQFTGSRNQDGFLETSLFGHPDSILIPNSSRDVKQSGVSWSTMTDDQKDSQILRIDNIAGDVKNVRMASVGGISTDTAFIGDVLQTQYTFGKWADTLDVSLDLFRAPQPVNKASGDFTRNELPMEIQSSSQAIVFDIVEISPAYASHTEETKIIVVGNWRDSHKYLEIPTIGCNIGDKIVPLELVQTGVYRTIALPHPPGSVSLYMTLDGYTPISQVMSFEYRYAVSNPPNTEMSSAEYDSQMAKRMEFGILTRLSHLLFTTTKSVSVMSSRISPNSMKEAKKFDLVMSSFFENQWKHFIDTSGSAENSLANHSLFELFLKDKLKEWIFLRIAEGCKAAPRDSQGQGVIHLCAMLDFAWAIRLFSLSKLSLDFRDSRGWTPLHWAAYYGREKTVAALLSAGANPCLVADPTPDFPGGCIPADLASQAGFEGLAAYLAEKGLGAHVQAMALSGNIDSSLLQHQTSSGSMEPPNLSEQELCLKDSLAAYRNAAEAADRIQTAFRERSLKQQMKVAQQTKPEDEAASIVAALKIQKAFRSHSRRKMMKAAVRIQGTFRTLQARKNFLRLRQKVIKIQAIFRGHLERRQYRKICWSVGIFEKAVLRWRLKRKGLRGLHAETSNISQPMEEDNCVEEDFFRVSREQAEERVRRSVVRVQAMFRSYQAQQEYRRIKMAYNEAKLEYPVSSADR